MKKLNIAIITIFLVGLQSCMDGFLNQLPLSTSSPETFYKTDADFQKALVGCYEALNTASISGFGTVATGTYNYGLFYVLDGCSDIAIANVGTGTYFDVLRASYSTNQPEINSFWIAFYTGISRCNYLLDNIENSGLTSELKIQYTAEARFMRAFYYKHLAELFGGVPICSKSVVDPKLARNNIQEVYTFIIDDFTYAYTNLSAKGKFQSSANKWTAGAYLGEVYNYLASCKRFNVGAELVDKCSLNDFAWVNETECSIKARDILLDVISNSSYSLVSAADYSKLFHEMSKPTQYKECLFLSEFANNSTDAMLIYYMLSPTNITYGGSYQRVFPTMKLYKSYNSADIRRDMFITGSIPASAPTFETIDNYKYYLPAKSSGALSLQSTSLWCAGKYRIADPAIRSAQSLAINQCTFNYPLMRMANVYLQYAEALYFTGDEIKAREQFNPIRSRVISTLAPVMSLADLNTAYYKSDFVAELLDERMRELCFESKRRIDLVRFHKTSEYINGLSLEGTKNLQDGVTILKGNWFDYKIWLPIPQLQIDINKNLVQNAGYLN